MSLFRGENPVLKSIQLDQSGAPVFMPEGTVYNDAQQKTFKAQVNGNIYTPHWTWSVNTTPVTAAQPSAANLMSLAVPAGAINAAGKTLYVFASGLYSTAAAQTPTVAIVLKLGSLTLLSWTSGATTASSANFPWEIDGYVNVVSSGSSATLEPHGMLNITLGAAAGGALSSYNDVNNAVTAAIDITAAQTLQFQTTMSTNAAGNQVVQRQFIVEVLN